tara:strand:- start:245 stop:1345 length:1101 start_codon:yes stop_codon:yes gene_type:complete
MANVLDLYNSFTGNSNKKLVYPLENQSDFLGKITFTPIEEVPVNIGDTAVNLVSNAKKFLSTLGGDDPLGLRMGDGTVGTDANGQLLEVEPATQEELEADVAEAAAEKSLSFFGENPIKSGKFKEESLKLNTARRISLYLPKAIQIQDAAVYDNTFQLGFIGGAAERGLEGGKNAIGAGLAAAVNLGLQSGSAALFGTGNLDDTTASLVASRLAKSVPVGGTGIAGAIESTSKITTNPNVRALFKNVPLRNFSFTFQLVPTSQQEARMVEDIIKIFREELYPETMTAAGVNIAYKYPNRFQIKVRYNNRDISGIKFLPVYLQSFNAVYNSATGGMHRDGRFSAIDISMTFTETRALSKQDVRDGGY